MVAALLAAATLAGCGSDSAGTGSWGPAGSGIASRLAEQNGVPSTPRSTLPSRPTTRPGTPPDDGPAIRPRDAFDTCGAITWDQFPAVARRPDRRAPRLIGPPKDALWLIGCLWDDRGMSAAGPSGGPSGPLSVVVIFWGSAPPLSTLPADHVKQGGVARTFAGRPGVQIAGSAEGARSCTSLMPVQPKSSVAGVSVAYSDPQIEPCAVAAALLEAIAAVVA
jgi:hypothetical protein